LEDILFAAESNDGGIATSRTVPTFYSGQDIERDYRPYGIAVEMTLGCIFGAVHCAAWPFKFQNYIELVMWRISFVVVTGVPLLMGLFLSLGTAFCVATNYKKLEEFPVWLRIWCYIGVAAYLFCGLVGIIAYVVARFLLLALAFSTLRHLPDCSLHVISWASLIPHFG
jgi:hypothetical protein